mgnify:CR=1 FL=1|jgi:hypothetical protein
MKIRWAIALLLLLNVITLAWQWDAFARWGWGPNVQREPERLQQQIKPEALQFTRPGQEVSVPAASASEATAAAPVGKASEALPAKPTPTPATVAPSSAASAPVSTAPATATPAKPASN